MYNSQTAHLMYAWNEGIRERREREREGTPLKKYKGELKK